jgi:hypothetical protein
VYSLLQEHGQRGKAWADIKWDYSRGYIEFPLNEPTTKGHYVRAQAYGAVRLEDFNAAIRHAYGPDPDSLADLLPPEQELRAFAAEQMHKVMLQDAETGTMHDEPSTYKEAMAGPDAPRWMKSMTTEYDSLKDTGTFVLVPADEIKRLKLKAIGCKWVYRLKTNKDGLVYKWKSRLVAKGFSEVLGQSYLADEVYAPVCDYSSLRTMLSIANQRGWGLYQVDISNAYLHSTLPRPQYMVQPPGFERSDDDGKPYVCKLLRGLYGTKSGGYHWHRTFDEFIKSLGFSQLSGDACFYKAVTEQGEIWLCLYVDDVTVAASSEEVYRWFIGELGARFPINPTESGDLDWILSMAIIRDKERGTLKLNQERAIIKLYQSLGLDEIDAAKPRGPVVTPMAAERLPKVEQPEFSKDEFDYLSVLGSVLHINMLTRPDISFAVNNLSRHASCPGKRHRDTLVRVVRYLFDTRELGVTYYRDGHKSVPDFFVGGVHPCTTSSNHLVTFADSDYAMDYTRRSTSGYTIMLNGGPVTWSSKLQKSTAQSTAEAEIIAATEAAKEALHLRLLLVELGLIPEGETMIIYEDNAACMAQAQQLRNRRAAKHYEVRLRFLQDHVVAKNIKFVYCPTKEQLADSFTKPLDKQLFMEHRQRLLGA